ncbi:hypothetical protein BZG36_01351 [Bifiguratus adelaidae]|uniref:Protein kinase domain-containing protein n=1 Tax=Bifiguratus adelaidae TaxID=1938954 RepID=A0A261Y3P2_9FUNG|nr:hypothetical protein BZG36_01351 [Bifiguratus adelaidae]
MALQSILLLRHIHHCTQLGQLPSLAVLGMTHERKVRLRRPDPIIAPHFVEAEVVYGVDQKRIDPRFLAPELFNAGQIDLERLDVWTLGVILYRRLTGEYPFEDAFTLGYREPLFISPDCADLLQRMLQVHPHQRPSLETILHHRWFSGVKAMRRFALSGNRRTRLALFTFSTQENVLK